MPYFVLETNNRKLGLRVWRWFLTFSLDLTFNLLKYKRKLLTHINAHKVMSTFNVVNVEQCIVASYLPLSFSIPSSLSFTCTIHFFASTSMNDGMQQLFIQRSTAMWWCWGWIHNLCDCLCMQWDNYASGIWHHIFHLGLNEIQMVIIYHWIITCRMILKLNKHGTNGEHMHSIGI
jgi:hypothetical protein